MPSRLSKAALWSAGAGLVLGLVGIAVFGVYGRRPGQNPQPLALDVLEGQPPGNPSYSRLESLRWTEIVPTAEGSCAEPRRARAVLVATAGTTNPPTVFLRGLLSLSLGDPQAAMRAFQAVPAGIIPTTCLYAPYRLQSELHPGQTNLFREPLLRAAARGDLPALLTARVMAREGSVQAALEGYLRSDPSAWAAYDLDLFPLLLRHSGLELETRAMLRAAVRGGRVKEELRARLEALDAGQSYAKSAAALQPGIGKLLQGDPESTEIAGRVAIHQIEIRRKFIEKRYGQLLREHADADAARQPDETVLLLTLSAAQQADSLALDRWSQEIKRRYPQPEVEQWIRNLRLATR